MKRLTAKSDLIGGLVPLALVLVIAGCATKGFVREEVQKAETRVGEQVAQEQRRTTEQITQQQQVIGKLEQRVGEEGERVSQVTSRVEGVGSQVRALEATVAEGKAAAEQAKGMAEQALGRTQEVDDRLGRLWSNRHKRSLADTISVYFAFNRANLDDRAETALADLARQLKENPVLIVELEGYTDSTGHREYNVGLSERRVESVRRFLVRQGVEVSRIYSVGLGETGEDNRSPEARAKNRRVTVKLFTPQ